MNEVTFLIWSVVVLAVGWSIGRWQIYSRLTKGVDFDKVPQKGTVEFTDTVRIVYRNRCLKFVKLAHEKEEVVF